MGNTYNVIAKRETLEKMLKAFPALSVEDEFSDGDWSVQVPDDGEYDDRFTDWCEENNVKYEMV
jgi:hypothetical protein